MAIQFIASPVLAANQDKRLELFVPASNGRIYQKWQTAPNGTWSDWVTQVEGHCPDQGAPGLVLNGAGHLELCVFQGIFTPPRHSINRLFQIAANNGWAHDTLRYAENWPPGTVFTQSFQQETQNLILYRGRDGRSHLFATMPGQAGKSIAHWSQAASGGSWSAPENVLSGGFIGTPAVATDGDGHLVVYVLGTDGSVYSTRELGVNPPLLNWIPWNVLVHPGSSKLQGHPVLAPSADGRLELFVVGVDGSLYHSWQVALGGQWSNWFSHGHPATSLLSRPSALAPSADGRLELFAVGIDGRLYHIWQVQVSGGWSDWFSHGQPTNFPLQGTPALASQEDGRLHIFVVDSNGSLFSGLQTTPSGTWSFWTTHPTPN